MPLSLSLETASWTSSPEQVTTDKPVGPYLDSHCSYSGQCLRWRATTIHDGEVSVADCRVSLMLVIKQTQVFSGALPPYPCLPQPTPRPADRPGLMTRRAAATSAGTNVAGNHRRTPYQRQAQHCLHVPR
jgi:hypothetical protein